MPARSKSQQRLFGMLHAYNKGELRGSKSLMGKMKEMSRHISDEDAQHFAKTPHEGLPEKKAYVLKVLEKLAQSNRTYTVRKGDTLAGISAANGNVPIGGIRLASGMKGNTIVPGQKLQIPILHAGNPAIRPAVPVKPSAVPSQRPSFPNSNNNPGNLRFYNQGWMGEQPAGLKEGDFTKFDTPQNGLRAAARLIMNKGRGLNKFTIANLMPVYSPKNENNVQQHISNISRISGIGKDDIINPDDNAQMSKLLKGLITAENNKVRGYFTDQDISKAIESGRTSR